MPVLVVCPECGATTSLDADAPRGRTVPCRQCGIQLPVPEPKPPVPPPLPPRPAPVATAATPAAAPPPVPPPLPPGTAAGGFEVLGDEGEADDRAPRDRDDKDELDDDGRPAVGRRGRYDDEEDDDRPRRREGDEDDDDEDRPRVPPQPG